MLASSLVAYLHFVAAFGVVATLFFEWFSFSTAPTWAEARRLALADRWYGVFAAVVLVAGFTRAYFFEKGLDYYLANPFFRLKLGVFVLIGLLSIYPTIRFQRWKHDLGAHRAPLITPTQYKLISRLLGLQMVLLAVLILSASLMAKGVRF